MVALQSKKKRRRGHSGAKKCLKYVTLILLAPPTGWRVGRSRTHRLDLEAVAIEAGDNESLTASYNRRR